MHIRSVRVTMGLVFVALILIGGLSVATSLRAIRAQQHDALILNLAGRQRMLSQKTAKEAWLGVLKGQDPRHLAQMNATAHQFEEGLRALIDGGRVVYAGTTVSVPPARDPSFRAALEEVAATWEPLHRAAHAVMENEPGSPALTQGAADLERLSSVILEDMDAAVRVYQAAAEARVARLRWIQLVYLLAGGLVLVLGFWLTLSRVLRPVGALETAVRRMEAGDLEHPIGVRVRNELGRLAGAFGHMRGRVKAQMREQVARNRILSATLRTLDLDERLNLILDEVQAYLQVELGAVHLVQGDQVVLRCWRGLSDAFRAHLLSFPADDPPAFFLTARVVHERLSEEGITPDFAKRDGIQAWASFPLRLPSAPLALAPLPPQSWGEQGAEDEGEWLGAILVGSRRYEALDEDQVQVLKAMADQLTLAIDHARAYRRAQERLARLQTLRDIDQAIIQKLDLQQVLHVVLERVPRELGADAAAISLFNAKTSQSEVFAMRLPNGTLVGEEAFTLAEGLLHWLVERQEPVIIYDLSQDPRVQMHRQRIRNHRLVSYLGVPLIVRDRTIGILHLLTTQPRVFADEDVAFFHTMAGQAAMAIQNAREYEEAIQRAEELRRRAEELEAITRVSREITVVPDLRAVLNSIAHHAAQLSHTNASGVFAFRPDGRLGVMASCGVRDEFIEAINAQGVPLGQGAMGRAAAERRPVQVPDTLTEPGYPYCPLAAMEGIRAILAVPMLRDGEVTGGIVLWHREPRHFAPEEVAFVQALAQQSVNAVENARLFDALQARLRELSALAEVSTALRGAATVQEIAQRLVAEAARLTRADAALLCLVDEARQRVVTLGAAGLPSEAIGREQAMGTGITGQVMRTGAIYRSSDLAHDPLAAHADLMAGLGPGICVPLRTTEGQVVSTLLVARVGSQARSDSGVPSDAIPLRSVADYEQVAPFSAEEERLLTTLAEIAGNALQRARAYEELEESYMQTVLALAAAMDARDSYTGDHSRRLAEWAVATARELGCSEDQIHVIRWGALLHDIGKIGVPDCILLKPGELDDEEWEVVKRHPAIGAEIVAPVKRLADLAPVIRAHQEHWDGSGYPDGLAGEDIPLGARILAVVDAYGAITDERPYKPARSHEEAVAELRRCAGTQFDPQVVDAFLYALERGIEIPPPWGGVKLFQNRWWSAMENGG